MYKVFLIDDNPYLLEELESAIDWENLGLEIIGSYENGHEAMQHMESNMPDIVLTDIKMPRMDGIELASILSEEYPAVKVVFMSSHDDFEYAKKAVDIGIYGYIMKPVQVADLRKALTKITHEHEQVKIHEAEKENLKKQMKTTRPIMQEQICRELLFSALSEDIIKENLQYAGFSLPKEPWIHMLALRLTPTENTIDNPEDRMLLAGKIRNIVSSYVGHKQSVQSVQMSDHEFIILYINENLSAEKNIEQIMKFAAQISIDFTRILSVETKIGISTGSPHLISIQQLYLEAREAVCAIVSPEDNPVIRYEEIQINEPPSLEAKGMYQEIKDLISLGDEQNIQEFVDCYINEDSVSHRHMKNHVFSIVNTTSAVLMEYGHSFSDLFGDSFVMWQKLSKFDTVADLRLWMTNIFLGIRDYLESTKGHSSKSKQHVQAIKKEIERVYNTPVTVQDITKSVYLSPSYANRCFRKETGLTIFSYLHKYRMEKAKELLLDNGNTVADVAYGVGYVSNAHFCLSFKNYVGLSPTEFRNKAVL